MVSENDLIGKSKAEAKALLTNEGVSYRIVREDERGYMCTEDYRPHRFNLELDGGIVTKVTLG